MALRVREARESEGGSVMEPIPIGISSDVKTGRLLAGVPRETADRTDEEGKQMAADQAVPLMRSSRKEIGRLWVSRSRQVLLSAGSFTMAFRDA